MAKYRKVVIEGNTYNLFTINGERWSCPRGMPLSVRVLGQVFQIHYHTKIYEKPVAKTALRGMVFYNERVILIDPEQSIHNMKQTLFHEMTHVYLRDKQRDTCLRDLTREQIEEVCDLLGDAFYDMLLNNSTFV
jgi:hypothetical protein